MECFDKLLQYWNWIADINIYSLRYIRNISNESGGDNKNRIEWYITYGDFNGGISRSVQFFRVLVGDQEEDVVHDLREGGATVTQGLK